MAKKKTKVKLKDEDDKSSESNVEGSGRSIADFATSLCGTTIRLYCLFLIVSNAYQIRLFAINIYGRVIHEFDPWFNFRATKYLAENGWTEFFHWFDYKVWYPLGRPVGTTIYPGMQIFSVGLWRFLNWTGIASMSLNDVCVFVPAWLGATSSLWLGALTAETSGSKNAGVIAAAIYAIIPAHIMRSVGGGYDNESVAMDTMLATFYFWVLSVRDDRSWPFGILAGVAYMCMAATWGGYIFIVNMVAIHAVMLVLTGRHSTNLHRAYTLFFVIGTVGAMQVPVVGWAPLRNLEQMGPLLAFFGIQVWEASHMLRRRWNLSFYEFNKLRLKILAVVGLVIAVVAYQLLQIGYFGPLGARIRGLFVKHTRTGNPLVDSVAEHQPGSDRAYLQYLSNVYYVAPVGLIFSLLRWKRGQLFLVLYGVTAYYFMNKMVRLIVIGGPIASALGGVGLGYILDWCLAQLSSALNRDVWDSAPKSWTLSNSWVALFGSFSETAEARQRHCERHDRDSHSKRNGHAKIKRGILERARAFGDALRVAALDLYNTRVARIVRGTLAIGILALVFATQFRPGDVHRDNVIRQMRKEYLSKDARAWLRSHDYARKFIDYSWTMAEGMSNPSIMFQAKLRNGQTIIVDDYREAYWWLRDNTPEDARVMAWWDYGYQITGIGERTTIADGNTWNHEHIATLGKALTSNQQKAHKIVRHLADYILIWTGGGGDDLAKSPHMARIGNSVYRDICPGDPTCAHFGFYGKGQPTPMMRESLLYNLHSHGVVPGVRADEKLYRPVFTSKYGKVKIFKVLQVSEESKRWVADPANRLCDAPGSWYCPGQYPPALNRLIASRKPFSQLEDFNAGGADEEYTKEYMARMEGRTSSAGNAETNRGKPKATKGERRKRMKELAKKGCMYSSISYKGTNSDRFVASDALECSERCDADFSCDVWSYKKETKMCRLKMESSKMIYKKGYISGAAECRQDDVARAKQMKKEGRAATASHNAETSPPPTKIERGWRNDADTTMLWELVHEHDVTAIVELLEDRPEMAQFRSEDGRGPLFWAYEYGHDDIAKIFIRHGADPDAKDASGRGVRAK